MIERLAKEGKVPGVHFCTMNLEKSVQRVTEGLGWAGASSRVANKLIAVRLTVFFPWAAGRAILLTGHADTSTTCTSLRF